MTRNFILALCCSLLAVRCTEDSSVAPIAPAPSFQIRSTYPPDQGVGPFSVYTPRPDSVKPHFTVYFNRSIKLSSLNLATISCVGFDQPVDVIVLNRVTTTGGDAIGFQVVKKGTRVPVTYRINATYSMTVSPEVEDYLGNQLGHQYQFSFKPEPYFRILGFNFSDQDTIIPQNVEIFFNSKLSPQIIGEITQSPDLSDSWSINGAADSSVLMFDTYSRVVPSTKYSIAVSQNATDVYGNSVHAPMQSSFFAPPLIISHNHYGSNNINLSAQIILYFNYPMDVNSINASFSVGPISQIIQLVGEKQLSFYAVNDFIPNTDYTMHLSTQLITQSGYYLPSPMDVTFHTADFAMTHLPADGETNVSTHNIIEFDFTGAVVTSTVASAITVSPQIDHQLKFEADTPNKFIYVYFVPTNPITANTTYKVIVSNTIQSIGGYTLAQPDTFSFKTGGTE